MNLLHLNKPESLTWHLGSVYAKTIPTCPWENKQRESCRRADFKELIRSKSADENTDAHQNIDLLLTGLTCMHRITRALPTITWGDGEENRCLLTHIQTLVRQQKQVQDCFKMSEGNVPPRCRNPPPCARGGPAPSPWQPGCWAGAVCARHGRLTSYL